LEAAWFLLALYTDQVRMSDDEDEPVDPVLEVLTEYEKKLRILEQNDQLEGEAQQTFGSLVHELERRTGRDRREKAREEAERRRNPAAGLQHS
jgi:hypothetical protein